MLSTRQGCLVVVLVQCLAVMPSVLSGKVAFPETTAARAAPPAAAAAPESRLLADAAGGFGLAGSAPPARPGQTRNLGLEGVLGPAAFGPAFGPGFGPGRRRHDCPLCDPSVYSYCGDKLLHDACCCLRDNQPLPPQCDLADCSFLHSKSCYEHGLITRCCCVHRLN